MWSLYTELLWHFQISMRMVGSDVVVVDRTAVALSDIHATGGK